MIVRQINHSPSGQLKEVKENLSDVNNQIKALFQYRENLDREYKKLGGK